MKICSVHAHTARLLAAVGAAMAFTATCLAAPPSDKAEPKAPNTANEIAGEQLPEITPPGDDLDGLRGVPTGACCLPASGACAGVMTAEACATASGTYQGDGSTCEAVNCDCLSCPEGAVIEAEAGCNTLDVALGLGTCTAGVTFIMDMSDMINNGCNFAAPNQRFQTVFGCGQTLCGTLRNGCSRLPGVGVNTSAHRRDNDWVVFQNAQLKDVTLNFISEIPATQFFINGAAGEDPLVNPAAFCVGAAGASAINHNGGCGAAVSQTVRFTPGNHVLFIGTGSGAAPVTNGFPCADNDGAGANLGGPHRYTLQATCANPPEPPANSECEAAVEVFDGVNGWTNVNAQPDLVAPTSSPCNTNANDNNSVWYKYTTGAAGMYMVDICGQSTVDTVVSIWQGACGSLTIAPGANACGDDSCAVGGGPSVVYWDAAANTQYFIRIAGWGNVEGAGSMNIARIPTQAPAAATQAPPTGSNTVVSDLATQNAAEGITVVDGTRVATVGSIRVRGAIDQFDVNETGFFLVDFYGSTGELPDTSNIIATMSEGDGRLTQTTTYTGEAFTLGDVAGNRLVLGTETVLTFDPPVEIPSALRADSGCVYVQVVNATVTGKSWGMRTSNGGPVRDNSHAVDGPGAALPNTSYTDAGELITTSDLAVEVLDATRVVTECHIVVGACCTGTSCSVVTEAACQGGGGAYQGDGTSCSGTDFALLPNAPVADGAGGAAPVFGPATTSVINIGTNVSMSDVDIDFQMNHTFIGDLEVSISHGATTVILYAADTCGGQDNMNVTFDDEGGVIACATPTTGNIIPEEALSAFDGQMSGGAWTLSVRDGYAADTGTIVRWAVSFSTASAGGPGLCNPAGACCMPDGSCTDSTDGDCTAAGGTFQGAGTNCGATACPQPTGACCLQGGECVEVTEGDCSAQDGEFNGVGTDCGDVECAVPTGSCCVARCDCQELTEADCATAGGVYGGDGSTCADPAQCFPNPACPCDVNGFDGLDSQDYFDFLDFFFNTDPAADINCFDGVDSQDFFDFLDCFFGVPEGC